MYKSFKLKNFRCFQELNLDGFERVNLIAGLNNVGKTALLEALFLHCGAYNPDLVIVLNSFRGIREVKIESGRWAETPFGSLFNNFDLSKSIEIIGQNEESGYRELRLRIIRDPEEIIDISQSIKVDSKKYKEISLSTEISHVLELEYKENGRSGKYYLILGLPEGKQTIPIPAPPKFPAFFLSDSIHAGIEQLAEQYGNLQVHGNQHLLLNGLKIVEPRLQNLEMVVKWGHPMLHGKLEGINQLIPIHFMGGGISRMANLILHIINAPKGVVLIDEIGNGLHYSILNKMWTAVAKLARDFDTQIFATTHSLECIEAAHKSFSGYMFYDFRLHRLECIKEKIQVITYNKETLEAAIETGLEIR